MQPNHPPRLWITYLMGISLSVLLAGCADLVGFLESLEAPANPEDKKAIDAASAQGILHFEGNSSVPGPLTSLQNADIFIVYTNFQSNDRPIPSGSGSGTIMASMARPQFSMTAGSDELPPIEERYNKVPQHIREFNNKKVTLVPAINQSIGGMFGAGSVGNPSANTVGTTTRTWKTNDGPVSSTLRGSADLSNGKRLYVWVNDSAWSTNEAHNQRMTPHRVNAVLSGFGTASPNIYDMTRKVYGDEWGSHPYGNLIANPQNEIHIVYYDIGNNGPWGILGYFWAVNNILNHEYGNNALVFFMDSATMGLMQGGSWQVTLPGPAIMMTTLAHEFQHMIHFYEKQVVQNTASPVWLNELASTASEDILAHFITGPNTGPSFGDGSRLAQFAKTPVCNITVWSSSTSGDCTIYDSYAHVSSFGGFLARHYGGGNYTFFRELVRSNIDSVTGLGCAIRRAQGETCDNGSGDFNKFAEAYVRWGASIVLNSAKRSIPAGYGYPALTVTDYFAAGQHLIMHQANIWGFSSLYRPRIYITPPATIRPFSHVVFRWQENITIGEHDMPLDLTTAPLATDLYHTIVIQAH